MTLNEYQQKAMTTRMVTCNNESYMLYGLAAEAGELMGKVAKGIRKGQIDFDGNKLNFEVFDDPDIPVLLKDIKSELGDVLWFVAGVSDSMGWKLSDVADYNLRKLADRKERGVIDGNGDNR